ncbi:GDP-4-keto-6-deoxy-D-mannose 3-dehydratase [bioreactor metagenome]|uniref:GDP-4-keto-6-deoxy-D-mannose 3-dehydratase n=1 Tax=bioreactor metagenome TaxID=1076179 RepID=A0A645F1M7_9ZZZZ
MLLAHTLGNPFDLATVRAFCDRNGLWLIEDNCDALGSEYTIAGECRRTGTWGDIGTSSFYPPHHMTMGEGGAVYTNHPLLSRIALSLRDWGRDCACPSGTDNFCGHRYDGQFGELPEGYDHKYVYSHLGYNLKVTDLQASVGCEQLSKLPLFIRRRKENWARLRKHLDTAADRFLLPEPAPCSDPSWFGFLLTCNGGLNRNALVQRIEAAGVQTRMLFSGNILRQPCMSDVGGSRYRVLGSLPNSDRIVQDTFWVGVYPGMSDEMIDDMAEIILRESARG